MAVQGGSRINDHVDGLLDYFRFESPFRPQLIHRLDKETSGVLLLSRKPDTTRRLAEAFKNRDVKITSKDGKIVKMKNVIDPLKLLKSYLKILILFLATRP